MMFIVPCVILAKSLTHIRDGFAEIGPCEGRYIWVTVFARRGISLSAISNFFCIQYYSEKQVHKDPDLFTKISVAKCRCSISLHLMI